MILCDYLASAFGSAQSGGHCIKMGDTVKKIAGAWHRNLCPSAHFQFASGAPAWVYDSATTKNRTRVETK